MVVLGLLLLLSSDRADMWPVLWQLMCGYIVLAFLGFCFILLFLDRIGAQADPESTGIQVGAFSLLLFVNVVIYIIKKSSGCRFLSVDVSC